MQYLNMRKAIGLIVALAFFVGGTQTALAVGTASGTTISNTATVDYDVAGDARSASSVAIDFLVDNRVDLTVANQDGGNVDVIPSATDQVLEFLLTNTGNTTQGYLLTTAIPTANIPMGSVEIYIEDGTTPGFQIAEDTLYVGGTNAGDLNPNGVIGTDDVMTVYVVADTPAGAVDGNQDDVRLVAQTTNAGTTTVTVASGAPTAGVDVVFADGAGTTSDAANDGQHSDAATYTVSSAALTAAKTIVSTTDEFGSGFAIPGANVVYQIRVTNSGAATADTDSVSITDQIPANTQLCVSTAATCTAPAFNNSGASGLALNAFEYSNDATATPCEPGDFTYTPTADANGYDATVTCVRMTTTGDMNGSGAFFDMQINVGIQ